MERIAWRAIQFSATLKNSALPGFRTDQEKDYMKNRKFRLPTMAALFLAALAVSACSSESSSGDDAAASEDAKDPSEMVVYKTASCGCCNAWLEHVREAGFEVDARDVSHRELNEIKAEAGLEYGLSSCHTAHIDGYVIEGHVPADDIRRLLEERPEVAGLTVPGMPVGSPGMEQGDRQDAYEVLTFREDGSTEVFASYHQ